jgi:NTE family protein
MRSGAKYPIGVALSGGALKAAAHVGVLEVLEAQGIIPTCIAGTSAGALVAALYAHGYRTQDLINLIRRFPGPSLFDYGYPVASSLLSLWRYRLTKQGSQQNLQLPNGLLRGKRLHKYIQKLLAGREATMPYYVVATDLLTGNPMAYTNDLDHPASDGIEAISDAVKTVLGSCSLPGILTPVPVKNRLLVDGGLRHYVPVDILRQAGCKKIIAINLYQLQESWTPDTFAHVLTRSFDILLQETVDDDIDGTDVVVLNPKINHMSWLSFSEMEECIQAGRDVANDSKAKIDALMAKDPLYNAQSIKYTIGTAFHSDKP